MSKPGRTRRKPAGRGKRPGLVYQFLVVLSGTDPVIWRRIQVPEAYSFWDLHVAIQDAMGWLDYHLHEFRVLGHHEEKVLSIGIPTGEESEDRPILPGWDIPISSLFEARAWHTPPALYAYDFGDDWEHALVNEGLVQADSDVRYPRCLSGARRCPPEDCGGIHGYQEFLAAISSAEHPDHMSMLEWVGGAFDPDWFDPENIVFEDPAERRKKALGR